MSNIFKCRKCECQFDYDDTIKVCPNCGSSELTLRIELEDEISFDLHETIEVKQKQQGVKKPIKETFEGSDWSTSKQKFVEKTRIIDRENDHYFEKVIDNDEVMHICDEKLTDHWGHGSAKK